MILGVFLLSVRLWSLDQPLVPGGISLTLYVYYFYIFYKKKQIFAHFQLLAASVRWQKPEPTNDAQ